MGKRSKWRSCIVVDNDLEEVTFRGKTKRLGPPYGHRYREFTLSGHIEGEYGSKKWENEMINLTLDSLEGTDWSKVLDIYY